MDGRSRISVGLRLTAAVATIAVAIVIAAVSWEDSGAFALVLAGVPMLAVAPLLRPHLRPRTAAIATWAAAGIVLAWAVLTGLGTGAYFAAPGVLLLVAAIASLARAPAPGATASTTPSVR
ncbi:hypothetical protein [Cellulomonas sp. NS3]|uniref:hypothetical protein n=1 Tax=Cellulomonas sp. NS3 TaxID=2973977 RepID=UPI0021622502|nr:hypothetical protein [Cellulomonas sp. NS3]